MTYTVIATVVPSLLVLLLAAEPTSLIEKETIQWGFAGLCVLQFVFLVWLVKQILKSQEADRQVIQDNTTALQGWMTGLSDLRATLKEVQGEVRGLHDELQRRPCVLNWKVDAPTGD